MPGWDGEAVSSMLQTMINRYLGKRENCFRVLMIKPCLRNKSLNLCPVTLKADLTDWGEILTF